MYIVTTRETNNWDWGRLLRDSLKDSGSSRTRRIQWEILLVKQAMKRDFHLWMTRPRNQNEKWKQIYPGVRIEMEGFFSVHWKRGSFMAISRDWHLQMAFCSPEGSLKWKWPIILFLLVWMRAEKRTLPIWYSSVELAQAQNAHIKLGSKTRVMMIMAYRGFNSLSKLPSTSTFRPNHDVNTKHAFYGDAFLADEASPPHYFVWSWSTCKWARTY